MKACNQKSNSVEGEATTAHYLDGKLLFIFYFYRISIFVVAGLHQLLLANAYVTKRVCYTSCKESVEI